MNEQTSRSEWNRCRSPRLLPLCGSLAVYFIYFPWLINKLMDRCRVLQWWAPSTGFVRSQVALFPQSPLRLHFCVCLAPPYSILVPIWQVWWLGRVGRKETETKLHRYRGVVFERTWHGLHGGEGRGLKGMRVISLSSISLVIHSSAKGSLSQSMMGWMLGFLPISHIET